MFFNPQTPIFLGVAKQLHFTKGIPPEEHDPDHRNQKLIFLILVNIPFGIANIEL